MCCNSFIIIFAEIGDFQKIVGTFIEVVDNVSKEVEKEKMKVNVGTNFFQLTPILVSPKELQIKNNDF